MAYGVDQIFRISGFAFSKTSVQCSVDGIPYTGITEMNVEESREGEFIYGQDPSGNPLGYTSGLYAPGAFTFKTTLETGEMICQQLSVKGAGSFGSYAWLFVAEIFENALLPSLTISVNNVKIEGRKFAVGTDAGALLYEFTCKHQGMTTVGEGVGLTGLPSILANVGGTTV